MSIRKYVAGAALAGALGVGALGLAGTASAGTGDCRYCPKPPVVSHTKTVTVTKTVNNTNSGQQGNGITNQTASGNAGAIVAPQIGLGAIALPIGLQIPINPNIGAATGGAVSDVRKAGVKTGAETEAEQTAKQRQYASATNNVGGANYTQVNNSTDNGNHSSVSIGN